MQGKGGPENAQYKYRGVRQSVSGKCVAEIRQPNKGGHLWLGTFPTTVQTPQAYDEAARAIYSPVACLNFPNQPPGTSSFCESTTSTTNQYEGMSTDDGGPRENLDVSSIEAHGLNLELLKGIEEGRHHESYDNFGLIEKLPEDDVGFDVYEMLKMIDADPSNSGIALADSSVGSLYMSPTEAENDLDVH
ncbi:Dehydration responsive element binding protein [Rhynchospora pubera]|uniref:Dehydration responsive element binding protein n=1 Tax=Rhynchospora pubera TaxID=906938 RepID=A0AAV8FYF9_9POAL|nr:Dehydration responsive element binding protein [Rhynchospora pubera]